MRKLQALFFILSIVLISSCCDSDGDNPVVSSGPLFSVTVLDSEGNPNGALRVGVINHPIGGHAGAGVYHLMRPCPTTPIQFQLAEAGDWEVTISDYHGNPVRVLSGNSGAGELTIVWDATDEDSVLVTSGFYQFHLVAGTQDDTKWMVLELGPDPHQTIIGTLNRSGVFSTDDTLLFPGLLVPPGIDYYTDTVTIHLSNPEFPDDFFYYTTTLSLSGNSFSFNLDSLGLPEALVRIRVVDTAGMPVEGLNVGSINHHFIEPTKKSADPDGSVQISFSIPSPSNVLLEVFDYYHDLVKTLMDGYYEAGEYTVTWNGKDEDGNDILSGYYEYELTTDDFNASKWLVFEKGPDPAQTIMGQTSLYGVYIEDDTLVFPALLGNPPVIMTYDESQNPLGYFHYADSITITLSDPEAPNDFHYFVRQLTVGMNHFALVWDPTEAKKD